MSKSELRRLNIQFEAKIAQLEGELKEKGEYWKFEHDRRKQLEAVKNAAIAVIEEVSPMNSDAATALGNLRQALKESK